MIENLYNNRTYTEIKLNKKTEYLVYFFLTS